MINAVLFTSDYNALFAAYDNGLLQCWNFANGAFVEVKRESYELPIVSMAYFNG